MAALIPHNTRLRATSAVIAVILLLVCVLPAAAENGEWPSRIRDAVVRAVSQRNGFPADQLDITFYRLRVPERLRQATGLRIEVPDNDDAIGPVALRAVFTKGGRRLGRLPIPVQVKVYGDVLVTRKQLKRHELIRVADIEKKRMEITRLVPWTITDADSVVGRWADRTISAGQIIDRRCLVDVPVIRRGDRVLMTYSKGAVRVSAGVVAMEDGYRNQQIAVKNEQIKRLLQAVVIDAKTVRPIR